MMAKAEKVAMAPAMASSFRRARAECETSCPPGSVRRLWAQRRGEVDLEARRRRQTRANFIL